MGSVNTANVVAQAKVAAAGISDPVAAAKTFRAALNTGGIHYSDADALTKQAFPNVDFNLVNPHHIGGFAKDVHQVGGAIGDVAKIAAPVLAATGVGLPLAAAISAAGTVAGRLNDKNDDGTYKSMTGKAVLTDAAKGLGRAALGSAAGSALGTTGILGGGGATGAGAAAAGAGASTLPVGTAATPSALSGILGSNLGKTLLNNPQILLAGAGLIGGASQQSAADKQRAQATQMAMDTHNQNTATRNAVLAKLLGMQTQRPDLSAVYADRGNPYRN